MTMGVMTVRPSSQSLRDEIRPDAAFAAERQRVAATAEAVLDQQRAVAGGPAAENVGLRRVADAEHALGRDVGVALRQAAIDRRVGLAEKYRCDAELGGKAVRVVAGLDGDLLGTGRDDVGVADEQRSKPPRDAGAQERLACLAPGVAGEKDEALDRILVGRTVGEPPQPAGQRGIGQGIVGDKAKTLERRQAGQRLFQEIESGDDLAGGEIEAAATMLRHRHPLVAAAVIAQHDEALAAPAQIGDRFRRGRDGGIAEIEHAPGVEHDEIESIGDLGDRGDATRHDRRG
jgi:hypothetical protein